MKKWLWLGLLVWGAAGGVRAQEMVAPSFAKEASGSSAGNLGRAETANVSPGSSHDFSSAATGSTSLNGLGGETFAAAKFAGANLATPVASAAPARQGNYRGMENDRWELGLGFTYVKFRSPAINQNMLGLNTSVAYFTRDWFGVEGNITAAFGGKIFVDDRTKYGGFTVGPKIVMRQGRWEPWGHTLVGLAHVNPQLAGVSKNGVAIQVGGGADYTLRGQLAVRMEGDWVFTHLYSRSQNNFQVVTGLVLHF
jgi:hypothetical protein